MENETQNHKENIFSRFEMLVGEENVLNLSKCRVAVFGTGGVGSYVTEMLVRSGVGKIDIFDSDKVSLTNLNRQIIALHSTLGKNKVDVMEERIKDINPFCIVKKWNMFFLPENSSEVDFSVYDYVADCIDTVSGKIEIIKCAKEKNVPVISSMGTGNKINPAELKIADIAETSVCPLARVMRKELKKRGIKNVKVIFSTEEKGDFKKNTDEKSLYKNNKDVYKNIQLDYCENSSISDNKFEKPVKTDNNVYKSVQLEKIELNESEKQFCVQKSIHQNSEKVRNFTKNTPSSSAFVPAAAGILIASEIIRDLIGDSPADKIQV